MASNYTEHYGLCQWEPGDNFIRSEFNADNLKIDAAIKAARAEANTTASQAQASADQALEALVPIRYNVYNLVLQNYYENKRTSWKRAMVFDGFLDGSGVESLSGNLIRNAGSLTLQGTGMGDIELGYSGGTSSYEATTRHIIATHSATLTGFRCRVYSGMLVDSATTLQYTVMVNGVNAISGSYDTAVIASRTTVDVEFPFSISPKVKQGDEFVLELSTSGSGYLLSCVSGNLLGGIFRIRSATGQSGGIRSTASTLPASGGLLGWVRHRNGTVQLSARDSGGRLFPFLPDGQRPTVELMGQGCTESAFRLDTALAAGSLSFVLDVTLGGAASMDVFDYGVILL